MSDITLGALAVDVARRLGDPLYAVWTLDELLDGLNEAYRLLTSELDLLWDAVYPENLPAGFSVSQPWELRQAQSLGGTVNYGIASFTAEFEREAAERLGLEYGPANHTSPFEATDGLLARAGASLSIAGDVQLPPQVMRLARVTWDGRKIDAVQPREVADGDSRYRQTEGDVYGYTWELEGVRVLRKIRVPTAAAATVTVNGSWGGMRNSDDLASDTPDGTWGVPRRIPGHHPLGSSLWGAPRRPFLEGMNVRVEHFRRGDAVTQPNDTFELPDHYARYLKDFAQSKALSRPGPGFDPALAKHFQDRWSRGYARVSARLASVDHENPVVMGGGGSHFGVRPPRPRLPWNYGSRVR